MGRWRSIRVVLILICVLLVGAVIGWAVRTVTIPAAQPEPETDFVLVDVREQNVGSTLGLRVVATWSSTPVGVNEASGIVTEVVLEPGDVLTPGLVLYRVDNRPVVAAKGTMPGYRDLTQGSRGPDVRQLQEFLGGLGYLAGSTDDVYGAATVTAVRAWQKELGVRVTGAVALGDIMYFPQLEVRAHLVDDLTRGKHLNAGEPVVEVYGVAPSFAAVLNQNQLDLVTIGTPLTIESPTGVWEGLIDQITDTPEGIQADILGPQGNYVCLDSCNEVPVSGLTVFQGSAILVPVTSGPAVPTSALQTKADGGFAVTLGDGTQVDVTVITSGNGFTVIGGVEVGSQVRVLRQ